ncbi:outer membrane protein assembly factor BamB family protein [Haladaptatus cibarius]|uniref:outer membrane protein assembly factor BamB family protein n=1 Tax=Haladaptatus cibarius TaxID=453847 RepID=UPI00067979FE|nr:PQQ-binding-like beta-propeller repeat protein [Haladaptatus cibarius]
MNPSPSSLSRRGFLTAYGTVGMATAVGNAQTTTTTSEESQREPDWTFSKADIDAYYPFETADGVAYVLGSSESDRTNQYEITLYAIDQADRTTLWTETLPSLANMVIEDGTVFVTTTTGDGETQQNYELRAFDSKNGDEQWRHPVHEYPRQLTAEGDSIYVAGNRGIEAIDIDSGSEVWQSDAEIGAVHMLSHVGSTIYTTTNAGVYALSDEDGKEQWHRDGQNVGGSDVIDADRNPLRLQLATAKGILCRSGSTVVSFDPENGDTQWTASLDNSSYSEPVLHEDTVYFWGDSLFAVSVGDGTIRWEYDEANRRERGRSVLVADGAVFSIVDQTIVAVNFDGSERWTFELPEEDDYRLSWGDIVDGTFYVVHGSKLRALSTEDGTVEWSFQPDEEMTTISVSEEAVLLGTMESLYCFDLPQSIPDMLVEETTGFLTSGVGIALSSVLLGSGVFVAYRRMNAEPESSDGTPKPELDSESQPDSKPEPEPEPEYGRLERIASDEFTETFRVRERSEDGPRVVVKKHLTDSNLIEEFESAVERWADLSDRKGVVPVLDFGDDWAELPDYEGGSLADSERPTGERIKALSDANMTVHRAHGDGLIHGGLRPETILLDGDGRGGVSDWELATAFTDHRDSSPYDAPEQVAGEAADERTDVYRLGAIAYFVLTGDAPAGASPPTADDSPSLQDYSSLSPELTDVLSTAMASNPDDRYQSVVKFDDMLRWATFRA